MPYILRDAYGQEYTVTGSITVGRDPGQTIILADTLASRLHATIWDQAGVLYIRDQLQLIWPRLCSPPPSH
jgi:hypothetical protein